MQRFNFFAMSQTTNTILMIRPISFRMNEQTAVNNYFQEDLSIKNTEINEKAQKEFDDFVDHAVRRTGHESRVRCGHGRKHF